MAEREIRYCTSADGARIAFSTLGAGPKNPAVIVQAWADAQEWSDFRQFDGPLAEERCVARYDRRGTGASQRDVGDLSLDAQVADLRAVMERLALDDVDVHGSADGAAVAVGYAARHPERVHRLLLWSPYVRGADVSSEEQTRHLADLIRSNWSLARRAIAGIALPGSPDAQRSFGAMLRESISPAVAARYVEAQASIDISALLPRVQAPTLVVYRGGSEGGQGQRARAVARLLPDARAVDMGGDAGTARDWQRQVEVVREFLGEPARPTPTAAAMVTILFTDIEDSTGLTQRLGDAKAQELVRAHNVIVREALHMHSGSEIKHTGDGIMASFPTASAALECAIALQRAFDARNAVGAQGHAPSRHPSPDTLHPLAVRIGLNAGEPVAEEADLFGTAVQLARRICDRGAGGEVLLSDVVRQLAAGKGFLFADRGEFVAKGFEDAVRLYEVRWRDG